MSPLRPLKIAILWHMHQPFYYDPESTKFKMPWVRLHATKDYLDMLLLSDKYDNIHPVFNFTPSLLQQIEMYLNGVPEFHIELTLKSPKDCSYLEKNILLKDFFMANWDTMIRPFSRYYELLMKRGMDVSEEALKETQRFFSNQDFLDLQLLFNLAWTDPLFRETDDFLKYLVEKGRGYSEDDKKQLIEKHMEIMGRIFAAYRRSAQTNKIEISTSPFYHPILPLLIDSNIARVPDPPVHLPSRFQHPEDAKAQITKALDYTQSAFGIKPSGMWPSEGSVSEDSLRLMSNCGIDWTATDERILFNSLNLPQKKHISLPAEKLYRPYIFDKEGSPITIFFRDHRLSDNIGFVYSRMSPEDAVNHFLKSLQGINEHLPSSASDDFIVPVILDGENAWEFYPDDARPFLNKLYETISTSDWIKMVTFKDFLEHSARIEQLNSISPGSWIDGNFKIWIGHQEDNDAWNFLNEVRNRIDEHKNALTADRLEVAMNNLYIAEGSDWCWWYGDEHSTEFDIEFDELFRNYVKDIYKQLGIPYPDKLNTPIVSKEKIIVPDKEMVNFVSPKLDGKISSYFEWLGAYMFNLKKFGMAMHRTNTYFESMYIGFDKENMYLRFDPDSDLKKLSDIFPVNLEITFSSKDSTIAGEIDTNMKTDFHLINHKKEKIPLESCFAKILEIKIPLRQTNFSGAESVSLSVNVKFINLENIRFPIRGSITFIIPPDNFEEYLWQA